MTTRRAESIIPHSEIIAEQKEKPYCTHSMSARTNTRHGNISFK